MIVRRFQAASTREALREVREALGPDALILSNRRLPAGGVELVAMSESTLDAATLPSPIPARAEPPPHWQAIDAYQQVARVVDDAPDLSALQPAPPAMIRGNSQRSAVEFGAVAAATAADADEACGAVD